jgi:hypothetical protein
MAADQYNGFLTAGAGLVSVFVFSGSGVGRLDDAD